MNQQDANRLIVNNLTEGCGKIIIVNVRNNPYHPFALPCGKYFSISGRKILCNDCGGNENTLYKKVKGSTSKPNGLVLRKKYRYQLQNED